MDATGHQKQLKMTFTVDLQPAEYRRAMLWHQFAGTPAKRINDLVGWAILALTPISIIAFALKAPEALSIWFWIVAAIAFVYAAYSTLLIRRQIYQQAANLPTERPALANATYRLDGKALHLTNGDQELSLTWAEFENFRELSDLFLLFFSAEDLLVIPKRCVADVDEIRSFITPRIG